jgi:hypothetical protein
MGLGGRATRLVCGAWVWTASVRMLWSRRMQRTATLLLAWIGLACAELVGLACAEPPAEVKPEPQPAAKQAEPKPEPKPEPSKLELPKPTAPPPIRKDLLAEDLPPVPTLESLTLTASGEGVFAWPEGTDELAPRAAVAVRDGLLLVGQAYLDRQPRRLSSSWRWYGFVPTSGEASASMLDAGAIRAAIPDGEGNALVLGTRGEQSDPRGWFAIVGGDGALGLQVDLDSPSATEMFDLIPGSEPGELAVVGGYVDAQGWLVSLDRGGAQRWQKFIGSYGYTQVRALVRLDAVPGQPGQLLALGTRGKQFGEWWWAKSPADGGVDPSPTDVTQGMLDIEGADVHQMLRAVVDLGSAGLVALGTAKKNHIQAHDQVVAVGFDRSGNVAWSKVIADLRVTEVYGARAVNGSASFVVELPTPGTTQVVDATKSGGLALLEISGDGATTKARSIADTEGWRAAGHVEGVETASVLGYVATETGIRWRRLALP